MDLSGTRYGSVAGSSESTDHPSVSLKAGELLGQPSNKRVLN
jgi:hypothetical protein